METELLNQVAQYGFPIVISMYLLVRMEQKIESLTNVIKELSYNISAITNVTKANITTIKKID